MWLAETKGEIRENTLLKRQAAELWCEKMSRTRYGPWRYLFVEQRKLERALAAGVRTFRQLVEALAIRPAEPQLNLISLDDERVKKEAFESLLPVYTLKAAAGYFGNGEAVEPEAWVPVEGQLDKNMFIARAVGRSMEPRIHDDDLLIFRAHPAGTRQNKIVLVQYRGPADPDTGGSYTVKRYKSEKKSSGDDEWRHTRIVLEPLNRDYRTIILDPESEGDIQVIAEWIGTVGKAT